MYDQPERIEEFKAEIARLRIKEPSTGGDRTLVRVALVGMVAGVVLTVGAYALSHGTTNPLQQRDAIVVALIGVAVTIMAAALYVRAALAGFLRFWLVRDLYERRAQTDRLLEALQAPAGVGRADDEPGREGQGVMS
jgi:hypothetical protein